MAQNASLLSFRSLLKMYSKFTDPIPFGYLETELNATGESFVSNFNQP